MAGEFEKFMNEAERLQPEEFAKARAEREELAALRRDAERYRWLRDRKEMDWSICNWCEDDREWMPEVRSPEVVDRAIDRAMQT